MEAIEFAKAYASLGTAVQEQLDLVLDGRAHECNPNAIDLMAEQLGNVLRWSRNDELTEIFEAIRAAQEQMRQ